MSEPTPDEAEGVSEPTPAEADDSLAPEELHAKTMHGLRWTVIGRPATQVLLLGSMIVLARLVAPVEFGRFAVAAIVGSLAGIPIAGVGAALVQRRTLTREHLQAGFALALLTGLALAALSLVAATTIVAPLVDEKTAELVRIATPLCLIVAAGTVPSALLQRRLAIRRLAVVSFLGALIRVAASIGMALAGLGALALVLGVMAGELMEAATMWIWAPAPHRACAGSPRGNCGATAGPRRSPRPAGWAFSTATTRSWPRAWARCRRGCTSAPTRWASNTRRRSAW